MAKKENKQGGKRRRLRVAHIVWIAVISAFLLASLVLVYKILFGENYRELALKNAQRLEFALEYKDGNATPYELEGETLTLDMAEALIAAKPDAKSSDGAELTPHEPPQPTNASQQETESEPAGEAPASPKQQAEPHAEPQPEQQTQAEAPAPVSTENAPAAETPAALSPAQPATVAVNPNIQPPLTKVEKLTEDGVLPAIAADGTKPWQFNRIAPPAAPTGHPRIAIVMMGAGLSEDATNLALTLPAEVSISVSPYAKEAAAWVQKVKDSGREALLDLPMESMRYPQVDMGPLGLTKSLTPEENAKRLRRVLSKARGIVGVISPEPDALSETRALATPFVQSLAEYGLIFVSGYNRQPEGLFRTTRQYGLPVAYSDIRLDKNLSETNIRNQLARAEDLAHNRGYAVVVTHSYPLIVELMANWIRGLKGKGYVLVPVSALAGS